MKNNYIQLITLLCLLSSCGIHNRMMQAREKSEKIKNVITQENLRLDSIQKIAAEKQERNELDTATAASYKTSIGNLKDNLSAIQQVATALEIAAKDRANFKLKNYSRGGSSVLRSIVLIDSFNSVTKQRVRVYDMLNDAVNIKTYNLFDMAAFFGSGVYQIPPTGLDKLQTSFSPVIDQLAAISNKYSDVPHNANFAFVGYSDGTPIAPGSNLYNELIQLAKIEQTDGPGLNKILSDLRSRELVNKVKFIMGSNANKFSDFNKMTIRYLGYGLGEEYPSKTITDYTQDDPRRRIVMIYWALVPHLKN